MRECVAPAFLVISIEIVGFGMDLKLSSWALSLIKKETDTLLINHYCKHHTP